MHAHRVEVFNRADDDDVVGEIAHHLELKLFPTENRLFHEHFMNRRSGEPGTYNLFKLFRVVGGAAASAAERERRPDDCRVAGVRNDFFSLGP